MSKAAIRNSVLLLSGGVLGAVLVAAALAGWRLPPTPVTAYQVEPGPTEQIPSSSASLPDLLQRLVPGVVSILVRSQAPATTNPLYSDPFYRQFFGDGQQPQPQVQLSAGSGIIVDASQGYIVTNNHVVSGAQQIAVRLSDGRTMPAELVGADQLTDVAVVRVKADDLTQIEFGDSTSLRVGDSVIAIGNPFGLGETVTSGIVSALGRTGLNIEGYEDFIQTDASINPGNSGGALMTLDGRLAGMNTAILAPSGGNVGIGFAVPSKMVKAVMAQLVQHGRVDRGQLGVTIQDLTPDLAAALKTSQATGAVVASVNPGSAADKAGLEAGDIIVAVDAEAVRTSADLRNIIGLTPVGTTLTLQVVRKGQKMDLSATIDKAVVQAKSQPS